jgi:hypothetical protein
VKLLTDAGVVTTNIAAESVVNLLDAMIGEQAQRGFSWPSKIPTDSAPGGSGVDRLLELLTLEQRSASSAIATTPPDRGPE